MLVSSDKFQEFRWNLHLLVLGISPVPPWFHWFLITEKLSFFSNSCQQNCIFPPFTSLQTISYFLWLTAFLANQHDHLFPREPLNQWEFSVLSENGKNPFSGGLSGRQYFCYCVSPSLAFLAFFFHALNFSPACHAGYYLDSVTCTISWLKNSLMWCMQTSKLMTTSPGLSL